MNHLEKGRVIHSNKETKLSPLEKSRQLIVEYLKDAELDSAQFQAFCDYTDLQNSRKVLGKHAGYNEDLLQETIRQRENSMKGYQREFEHISLLALAYFADIRLWSSSSRSEQKYTFARELAKIKTQELARKSQEHLSPPAH